MNASWRSQRPATALLAAIIGLVALTVSFGRGAAGATPAAAPLVASCPASLTPGQSDFHGLTLTLCNFSGQTLKNANFDGARLTAVNFTKADLTGATFKNAVFVASGQFAHPVDFSFATLRHTRFDNAIFSGGTFFTYASIGCASFDGTDVTQRKAIFGPALALDATTESADSCRTTFNKATMSCEFVAQWNALDLTSAGLGACRPLLETVGTGNGHDFSNGRYAGVSFQGFRLARSRWNGADLTRANFQQATLDGATGLAGTSVTPTRLSGAQFNNASVQNVDLSYALLYGADFTLANLTNSSFAHSFLNSTAGYPFAAKFDNAHLRNVDMTGAQLAGASFTYASLYGTFGFGAPTKCTYKANSPLSASTCASVAGATLTLADFSNAYLAGLDLSGATIDGTNFSGAILIGATFDGATFSAISGRAAKFPNALLQGAIFSPDAALANVSMEGAYFDFGSPDNPDQGNTVALLLGPNYTGFAGSTAGSSTCVEALYGTFGSISPTVTLVCPNGSQEVCGATAAASPPNAKWRAKTPLAAATPTPGWYANAATYAPKTSSVVDNNACPDGSPVNIDW